MADVLASIDERLRAWIAAQRVFFVATAPLGAEGRVNCSPRGGDCFRLMDDRECCFLDYTGSGTETAAHLAENGRICVMFCGFEGPPRILRIHGRGEVLPPDHSDFARYAALMPSNPGSRAVVRIAIGRISSSCGFGVPRYDFVAERDTLDAWAMKKGPEGLAAYRAQKNARSIDHLPGFTAPGEP
jgi:hypothetical protein